LTRAVVVPRPDLWRVRSSSQIYMTASVTPIKNGPALTFTAHIPDMNHYNGRGGRAIPLYRAPKAAAPNLAPKLLSYLARRLGASPTPEDVLAYVAGVVAHPAYTQRFHEELIVPGVRIPLTANPALWEEAVRLGREVLWLHTFGERYIDPAAGRAEGPPRQSKERRPRVVAKIPDTEAGMPTAVEYDPQTQMLHIGAGRIERVSPPVWAYEVSGWRVVKRWFDYRKRSPRGRRSSKLDHVVPTYWRPDYTTELLNLLQVLGRLVELHPAQADLLDRICAGVQITAAELEAAAILPPPAHVRRPVPPEGTTLLEAADH